MTPLQVRKQLLRKINLYKMVSSAGAGASEYFSTMDFIDKQSYIEDLAQNQPRSTAIPDVQKGNMFLQ